MFLACIALIGNVLGIDWLRNFTPWGTYIKTNPALCLLLISIALWMQRRGKPAVPMVMSTIVLVISLVTLGEWVFGVDPGVDQLLSKELVIREQEFPGRMPPNACLCFMALGASILAFGSAQIRSGQILAAMSFCVASISVVGLAFGLNELGMFSSTTMIAFPMAVALVLASFASFMTYSQQEFARVFSSTTFGGIIARSIIPLSAAVPLIGALSSGVGKWSAQDVLILALFNAVIVPIIVWRVAIHVDRLDSERQLAFEEAVKAKEQADNASAAKANLVAIVTHEVRSPLAGVIGLNELITHAKLDDDTKALADLALTSAKRLLHVLNDLLDYSKLDAGKVELEEQEIEPAIIVADAVLACRSQTLEKNIQIESHIDPEIPKTVIGDQLRISQILLNFISNAAKFTRSGTIRVSADLISQHNDSLVVKFSVRDTGVGISEETMAKLFQPFVQADASTSRRYGGSGLGLSIAKHYAELMGGTVGAGSETNQGSTFWAELPFKKAPANN
jgi:signal transduction histidine kinase